MERIQEGFDVFVHDGNRAFGAVRQVLHHGIIVYVENGGDFEVAAAAVKDVHDEKVVLDSARKAEPVNCGKLATFADLFRMN